MRIASVVQILVALRVGAVASVGLFGEAIAAGRAKVKVGNPMGPDGATPGRCPLAPIRNRHYRLHWRLQLQVKAGTGAA